jgi:hypothetical protein
MCIFCSVGLIAINPYKISNILQNRPDHFMFR